MEPLAIAPVAATGTDTPDQWIVFLHGILGSGSNWRTFARQIVSSRPHWGALLVDLRLHGDSQGFGPPHTLASAAADVVTSVREKWNVKALLGHSFGGKVGIGVAGQMELAHLFVVDSTPGARPDHRGSSGVRGIVDMLQDLPDEFANRDEFMAFVEARGVSRALAMWLAMNVRPVPNTTRFVFRIDVPSVRAMMEDYFQQDLWHILEAPSSMETHIIAGAKSEVLDQADLERGRAIGTVDVIPDAGHWVHVDAPDALRAIVEKHLV